MSRPKYEPALDGLRAIAATAVLLAHAGVPFLPSGGRGVDVFFVLSGYLITSILMRPERIDLREFWSRRLRRLLPALFVMLPCAYALSPLFPAWHTARLGDVALAATYTMNIALALGWPYGALTHTWSLAQEMQFYILWPLALPLVMRLRDPRQAMLLTWIALSIVYEIMDRIAPKIADFSPVTHLTGLLLGAWLAMGGRMPNRFGGVGLLLITEVFVLGAGLPKLLAEVGAALLIADITTRESRLRAALSTRPLVALGVVSYGVYLWHVPVASLVSDFPIWAKTAVTFTGSVGLATLSYWLLERRFLISSRRASQDALALQAGE